MPCKFCDDWLSNPLFSKWVRRDKDETKAFCIWCRKSISVASMGAQALRSHIQGAKHSRRARSVTQNLTIATSGSSGETSDSSTPSTKTLSQSELPVSSSDVLSAETWWTLKTVSSNYSFHSNADTAFVLRQMFPNHPVADRFALSESKTAYFVNHGLAPYYRNELEKRARGNNFVMLFDESLNRDLQKKQMDFYIRLWTEDTVRTHYFDSKFLGHSTSEDMLDACAESILHLNSDNLLQIGMDGPHVNWAFHTKVQNTINEEHGNDQKLLDIGSCGLHQVNNAFKAGAKETEWDCGKYLKSLHTLLKDVPARRADYEKSCRSEPQYPLKFCTHRWVENSKVVKRALEIHEDVKKFVSDVHAGKYNKKEIDTDSFKRVESMIADPLLTAKLACFESVSGVIEQFLTKYQTDEPMVPFLCGDLAEMVRKLMSRFIKPSVLDGCTTVRQLLNIDVSDANNHQHHTQINPGFIAERKVSTLYAQKQISDRQVMSFHMDCKSFYIKITEEIMTKSALRNLFVRCMSVLDPVVLYNSTNSSPRFKKIVTHMVSIGRVEEREVDTILEQFQKLTRYVKHEKEFEEYDSDDRQIRLDVLYYKHLQGKSKFAKLWTLIQQLLTVSHGQATVERGFSTNKGITTTNISPDTIISRRLVKDHILSVGGLQNVKVTPQLLQYMAGSYRRYEISRKRKAEEHQAQSTAKRAKKSSKT